MNDSSGDSGAEPPEDESNDSSPWVAMNANDAPSQIRRCGAQLLVFVARIAINGGFVVGGGYRLAGADDNSPNLHSRFERVSDTCSVESTFLKSAFLGSETINRDEMERQRRRFDNAVVAISAEAEREVLKLVVRRIRSATEAEDPLDFWLQVARAVESFANPSEIAIYAVNTKTNPAVCMPVWPSLSGKGDNRAPAWRLVENEGWFVDASGRLVVPIRHAGETLGAIEFGNYSDVASAQRIPESYQEMADAVGHALVTFRAQVAKRVLLDVESELSSTSAAKVRLGVLLQRMARLLDCNTGHISLADENRKWMRVVQRFGSQSEAVPYYMPADQGVVGRVFASGLPSIVSDAVADPDFRWVLDNVGEFDVIYKEEHWRPFHEFLKTIGACVRFPLCVAGKTLGVICLNRSHASTFDLIDFYTASKLTERIAVEAARLERSDSLRSRPPQEVTSQDVESLVLEASKYPPEMARRWLCQELADVALATSGAYRTGVRLLDADQQSLVVLAAAPVGAFPERFMQSLTKLDEDTAATWAYRDGRTYMIEDTSRKGIHFRAIASPSGTQASRSHTSILLQSGTHTLGVLSVDWPEPGAFHEVVIEHLERVAGRYATAINSYDVSQIFARLDGRLKRTKAIQLADVGLSEFLQEFLLETAEMVGCRHGAIFLWQHDKGRYYLSAHLARPDWVNKCDESFAYEPGEGITGWVAANNQPIRICDISDVLEREAISAELNWTNKVPDGSDRCEKTYSVLIVPMSVGGDVLGVLRLANKKHEHFSINDQQNALAAASRLAGFLRDRQERRRTTALMELSAWVVAAKSEKSVAQSVFKTIGAVLGECSCHMRIFDEVQFGAAQPQPVLRRLAASVRDWERVPLTRAMGEGIAGRVWEQGVTLSCEDVQISEWIREAVQEDVASKELLGKVGCVVATPFRFSGSSEIRGTLHVHKRNRKALLPGDVAFLEEVAKIAAPGLEQAERRELAAMELQAEHAIDQFMKGLLSGQSVVRLVPRLLLKVLKALMHGLGGWLAWVGVPDDNMSRYRVIQARGIPIDIIPAEPIDVIEKLTGPNGARVVFSLGDDPDGRGIIERYLNAAEEEILERPDRFQLVKEERFQSLVNIWREDRQSMLKDLQVCLLSMRANGLPLASFCLVVAPPDAIRARRVEWAVQMIRRISDLVSVGMRFEESTRETEITRPLVWVASSFSALEHETRSPISTMGGAIDYLYQRDRSPHDARAKIRILREEHLRLRKLINDMISIAGLSHSAFKPVDIVGALAVGIETAERDFGSICVARHLPATSLLASGINESLAHAFQLLVRNALEAVQSNNGVRLVTVTASSDVEGNCRIVIEDNGPGMTPDQIQKAFQPFQTTKSDGRGTGLGMPAAYSIIRSHGGWLDIKSQPGQGSQVVIRLPLIS